MAKVIEKETDRWMERDRVCVSVRYQSDRGKWQRKRKNKDGWSKGI